MLQHFSGNEQVHWGLGWAHYATGRYDEALQFFAKALELKADNWATQIARAMCYHNLGNYAKEIECYDAALAIRPDLDFAMYNRGLAAHALGDTERARQL